MSEALERLNQVLTGTQWRTWSVKIQSRKDKAGGWQFRVGGAKWKPTLELAIMDYERNRG